MPVASDIESLQEVAARFAQDGPLAAADLVDRMLGLSAAAKDEALEDLSRLCRKSAERLQQNLEQLGEHRATVQGHVASVIDYASACAAAVAAEQGCAGLVAPAELTLVDLADEGHFLETMAMFVSQSRGSLAELEQGIRSVAVAEVAAPAAVMHELRSVVHTLMAEFGVLNLLAAQKLCHEVETAIDSITERSAELPIDLMLDCVGVLQHHLERLAVDARAPLGDPTDLLARLRRAGGTSAAPLPVAGDPVELDVQGEFADSIGEFISGSRAHLSAVEAAMRAFANDPDTEHLRVTYRAFHTIKGVAGFLNLTPLAELAHASEALLDEAQSCRVVLRPRDVELLLAAGDLITQLINGLEGQPMPTQSRLADLIEGLELASRREAAGQAAAGRPDDGVMVDAAAPSDLPAEPPAAVATEPQPSPQPRVVSAAATVERTVKVNTNRLSDLVDMVGELVSAQSMVLQDPALQQLDSPALSHNIGQVSKITRELQEAALSLRMVTVEATFRKMAQLVEDEARQSGKVVRLTIQGEDTELARDVVEQISDPLVHLIRNAIEHGIEAPDVRVEAGKDADGRLQLRAYHQGGSIVIEVQDDGRGLDQDGIAEVAVERGLLRAGTVGSDLSAAEAFGLVGMPGFSAAPSADGSGRVAGTDVLRRNLEALRGRMEIESTFGSGTTFRLRLPLTLAMIDGMLVRVGSQSYVVPTQSIEQSFRPDASDVHFLADRGECVRVHGTVLPIHRLKQIFAQDSGHDDLTAGILLVVAADGDSSCLFVDEILGQQHVVIQGSGGQDDSVTGVSGGAIMSDGRLALVLDVAALVSSAASA